MSKAPVIEDAVSIVPVLNLENTLDFYQNTLGFEKRFVSEDNGFAIVGHGDAAMHFIQTDDEDALKATANNISIYLWAKNIDQLYEQLKPELELLPEGRLRAPFNQPYGMKEFHVKDPDGCLLLFGEEI